jgi:putative oxygen-independent coproporphyrinogen III oxidase
MRKDKPQALYLHIPFCKHKCHYCDFNTYAVQGQPVDAYLSAMEREMEQTVALLPPDRIDTIFVGGGTPTILDPEQMHRFLEAVQRYFPERSDNLEFTMEANPGTTDLDKLQAMREGGVNRISFGVQSFDNGLLKDIGRIHKSDDVYRSVENARKAGFDNISIDLMFGLPGQTVKHMEDSLQRAMELELQHYSLYSLKVEENTLFHTLYQRGELPLPDEDEEVAMYEYIMDTLSQSGYEQYEISNFSRPGKQSRHNMKYWLNHSYYGLGAGAHGYTKGVRHVNIKGVKDYIEAAGKQLPIKESNIVDDTEAMEDFMMVGLRLLDGVRNSDFEAQFDCSMETVFGEELRRLTDQKLLESTDDGYKLTRKGLFIGNDVFSQFIRD